MTLLLRRPNHFQSDKTASASFSEVRPTQYQVMQNASQSLRTGRLRQGWPTRRQNRSKDAVADPIRRPSGPREALDGAEKLQKWPLKGFKRPQKPSKKASGEATGDHGGSRRLKEGLLVVKNCPRRPGGGQESSKKPFWCHFGAHFGGQFWHMFGSKIGSKFGSVFGLVFGSVLVPKSDPNRSRESSTWH